MIDAKTARAGILEKYSIGGRISTTKRKASKDLAFKLGVGAMGTITRAAVIANTTELKKGPVVRFDTVEQLDWGGVGCGGAMEAKNYIHAE